MTSDRKAKLIVFLNALTLVGGAITIYLLAHVIGNIAAQFTATNKSIINSQKLTEKEIRCLAVFYAQPDWKNTRISDIAHCKVVHTDTGKTETLPLEPVINIKPSPAVQPSSTKQNSTTKNKATQSKTTNPSTSTLSAPSSAALQVNALGVQGVVGIEFQGSNLQLQPAQTSSRLVWLRVCTPFGTICVR